MKTSMLLISAVLAGSTAFAAGEPNSGYGNSYGTSGTSSQYDNTRKTMPTDERHESAYDSAMKPDRTMRHNTRQGRASTDYYQNDVDRNNWDRDGYRTNQTPDTRQ